MDRLGAGRLTPGWQEFISMCLESSFCLLSIYHVGALLTLKLYYCLFLFYYLYYSCIKMLISVLVIKIVMVRAKCLAWSSPEDYTTAATCSVLGSGCDSFSGIRVGSRIGPGGNRFLKFILSNHESQEILSKTSCLLALFSNLL